MAKKGRKMGEAQAALSAFLKAHKGQTLSDAQKEKLTDLRKAAGAEKFKGMANVQLTRAFTAIDKLTRLAKLPHTKEQVSKIKEAFNSKLGAMATKYDAKAAETEKKVLEIV